MFQGVLSLDLRHSYAGTNIARILRTAEVIEFYANKPMHDLSVRHCVSASAQSLSSLKSAPKARRCHATMRLGI